MASSDGQAAGGASSAASSEARPDACDGVVRREWTPRGYMIQTLTGGWRFENDPDGTKTAEAYDNFALDLSEYIEKPQSTASASDRANLLQKLKDMIAVLEQPDGNADAENAKIAELAEAFEWMKVNHPEEISSVAAAQHIIDAHAGKFVKMGQDAKGTNVSFNPLAFVMQENIGLSQKMTRKNDEPGAHLPADTDGGWVMVQQGPNAGQEEEMPQQPKRQRRMNQASVLRAVCRMDIHVGPEMQEEFKSGIIDNPAHAKFQEYQDANTKNAENDARNKAKWEHAMLDLTDLDNAMSPVNIKFPGEEMDTKGKVQSIFDQINSDNRKSRRMEELIKITNVEQWEEENRVDFPLKCVKLWEACPNRKLPGLGPPKTDEDRGMCLMGLTKRFRNQCRYVTDRWTRERGPPPKLTEEDAAAEDALATHLHKDIVNGKKFTTNSYGAFKLCNPQNRGQDSDASIYGNTVITALAATQGKEPAAGSGFQPTRTEENDDHLLPPTAKIINPVLAIQEDDENVHWVRRIKTYSWDQILCENMQNCNLKDILSTWLEMPLVCQGCSLRGSRKKVANRRAKAEQELADVVQKAKNFLQANNLRPPNDPKDAKIIVQMALAGIAALTFACPREVQASVMSIPKAAVRDSKLHMQARAEYDERLTFPLEALVSFHLGDGQTVCEYLGMSRSDSQQTRTAVALKYYRCPYDFVFTVTGKGGTRELGPYPCGAVTCARSDWHHSRRSGGQGPKNIWQCTRCLGDWMKGQHGTMMVVVITGQWVMNLVLDSPPTDLLQKWVKERIEYYERMEPCDTMRDEMPLSTPDDKYRLELQGELSNAMWGILMGKHDDDEVAAFREIIRRDAAPSLGSDKDDAVEQARKMLDKVTQEVSSANKDENGRVWSGKHWQPLAKKMLMQVDVTGES